MKGKSHLFVIYHFVCTPEIQKTNVFNNDNVLWCFFLINF